MVKVGVKHSGTQTCTLQSAVPAVCWTMRTQLNMTDEEEEEKKDTNSCMTHVQHFIDLALKLVFEWFNTKYRLQQYVHKLELANGKSTGLYKRMLFCKRVYSSPSVAEH